MDTLGAVVLPGEAEQDPRGCRVTERHKYQREAVNFLM